MIVYEGGLAFWQAVLVDIGTLVIVVLNGMRPLSVENREIVGTEKGETGVAGAAGAAAGGGVEEV